MMDEKALANMRSKLDELCSWPTVYMFKFIVARERLEEVVALFGGRPVATRDSAKGRYVSVTAELEMETSAEVVAIYREASKIKGIIAL